ncbi:hypothetical protein PORY_001381 [Pneumocystis oryctolagi]|uniref:Uncharacterized protein n=1 Tax=Pneumocystis oryctolagi TaxID=42067 RepID=A0ACB7CC58_9ASCO|nr:hypothetical protein PORY_001381 [Pneumocystis oryctolagi]
MSKLSKITFFATTTVTFIIIGAVHYIQHMEKNALYEGVLRDEARQMIRKQSEKKLTIQRPQTIYEKNQSIIANLKSVDSDKNNT